MPVLTLTNPFRRFVPAEKAEQEEKTIVAEEDSSSVDITPSQSRDALRVLFFSANTGGGHKASAQSLIKQFELHFPGSQAKILNMEEVMDTWPYVAIAENYNHLTQKPQRWRIIYHTSNHPAIESVIDWHSTRNCQHIYEAAIADYNPDVIVSVHPALNYVPLSAARAFAKSQSCHIPFFTVVTDLGSAHWTWFQRNVDRLYCASERLRDAAVQRGRIEKDKTMLMGLPIRQDFAQVANDMGERGSDAFCTFQKELKAKLELAQDKPMVLVMGGGEGTGNLRDIVEEAYAELVHERIDATVCVVCAKNEELKESFETTNWQQILIKKRKKAPGRVRRLLTTNPLKPQQPSDDTHNSNPPGDVTVVPLGFVTNMAEYMAAADLLVTKAGPGTIAEAAALGLPVLLTSFLPGQEAGNVDFVCEKGFGKYVPNPVAVAQELRTWLQNGELLQEMSTSASSVGHPDAAKEIVLDIGSRAHAWKEGNAQATKVSSPSGDEEDGEDAATEDSDSSS